MSKKLNSLRKDFAKKLENLECAKTQLKQEFVGIDRVIDQIIENVRPWYTMNEVQEKPAVMNLWGLTGVGKTSLIIRLMELLEYQDHTYRIDLGEKSGHQSLNSAISEIGENRNNQPLVIILDEFQHARTVRGPFREEIERDENRLLWELIDSGKITSFQYQRNIWGFEELIAKLKKLIGTGVEVKNGLVVKGRPFYEIEINTFIENENELPFFPPSDYETLIELAGNHFDINLRMDLMELLFEMNGEETIQFLNKAVAYAKKPYTKNFSHSLIFVLGNIDEAYTMCNNYNTDISADEFYRLSLKITLPKMKIALRSRFRDEQIARLGNIHVIYPAFDKVAYEKLICMELDKMSARMTEMYSLSMTYDKSVVKTIYKEGVYPSQGARPIFTTIHQLIKSKLGIYINQLLMRKVNADTLSLTINNGALKCEFVKKSKVLFAHSEDLPSDLEKLRVSKKDEVQAITAVHEAGHTVLSIALLNRVPDLVVSVTSSPISEGFMYMRNTKKYLSKKDLIPKTAVYLGGIVAEEIIFGAENITAGSSSDIERATSMLSSLLKREGMHELPVSYAFSSVEESTGIHNSTAIEERVKELIHEARELARKTLIKEKQLLLAISKQLSVRSKLEKKELQSLRSKHMKGRVSTQNYLYRKLLQNSIEEQQENSSISEALLLNKSHSKNKAI